MQKSAAVMESKAHWERIYQQKQPEEVSWYKPHLDTSLKFLNHAGLNPESPIIDVGGGASTLVDDLLDQGIRSITVLDVSHNALAISKARLAERAAKVAWIEADVTQVKLPVGTYDLWHDRAVFHFLRNSEDRQRYIETLTTALKSNGQLIIATFALEGPPRCSGLEVVRYKPETLQAELGHAFQFVEALEEEHHTPFHTVQRFLYARFQKI